MKSLEEFPIEMIPDDAILFRRVAPWQIKKGQITSAAFEDCDLSVDWEKYSTPQESLERLPPRHKKNIDTWKVTSIVARSARALDQIVRHDPENNSEFINRAHTLIEGEKELDVSENLLEFSIEIV